MTPGRSLHADGRHPGRRRAAAARALLLALALLLLVPAQAQAAGYRYWSFWDRSGDRWIYATQGPSTARPSDGDVQGFRFAVSADSSDADQPRGAASFDAICARTPAQDGTKRIALVIDFGTAADAPSGETPPAARSACAQVGPDATTAVALASVAEPLRYDTSAMLCAIAGYPRTGCGEQVSSSDGTPTAEDEQDERKDDGSGPSMGLIAGGAVVAVLAGAAVWQARRRRNG
ncbi:SCO2322 family protein [Streptomyces antibioticus]|uniref:SCO2322 family protein n=1 Tax=Streptomyces antibioticus TaxID=1890 RepID=UPI0033E671FE